MATRFYLESDTGSPGVTDPAVVPLSPAYDASWNDTGGAARRWAAQTSEVTAKQTASRAESTATSPYDVLLRQFVSPPLSAQTISGTVKGQLVALESPGTSGDLRAQVLIWVVKPDNTSRGTLLALDTSALSSEFDGSGNHVNRKFPLAAISPASLSSLAVSAGDRIVIEVGYRAHNAISATTFTGTVWTGTYGTGTDLPEDETSTYAYNGVNHDRPWMEFSSTLTFEEIAVRLTEQWAEVPVSYTNPHMYLTEVWAEVIVEATPYPDGYWGILTQ